MTMLSQLERWMLQFRRWFSPGDDFADATVRYRLLRRNLVIAMLVMTLTPLLLMAVVNYHQYQEALIGEIGHPLRVQTNKTRHSFELFLAERLSALNFIASSYSYEELADEKTIKRIFRVMKQEFTGFVDVGLIDSAGFQASYVGPYELMGKNYAKQNWFHEVQVRKSSVSDVFLGYRKFPHVVIAVQHLTNDGQWWVLRAAIDTTIFDQLIATMGLGPESDAFLINRDGILQTSSKYYGKILENCSFCTLPVAFEPNVIERVDDAGRDVLLAYSFFLKSPFALIVVTPRSEVLKAWYTLKSELFYLLVGSILVIFLVVFKLSQVMVHHIRESDEKREEAFREMEHTHKLSSIGRLAAGVAHEINNPLAIINEKAGLAKDVVEYTADFPDRERFLSILEAIPQSVERCKVITHRLLGFARRMELAVEVLDLNEIIKEVLNFIEKEALYRNIVLRLFLADALPKIASDPGQLQQVFLNILTNAFAAVEDGGIVTVTSWEEDLDLVAVSIQDNGEGMSEETLENIFEPFFTTKREYGTGLGLSITYGIVQKLGGAIKVHSKLEEGTTFTVYLPKKPRNGGTRRDGKPEGISRR
jgi:two-component system, NtrC family, sensor kinase